MRKHAAYITDWTWPRIKAAIEETADLSLSRLAARHGKSRGWLANIRREPVPEGQRIISELLGVPPQAIWPSRYDRNGRPVSRIAWLRAHRKDAA